MKKIAVIIGSVRQGSFNKMIAKSFQALAPASIHLEIVEIDKLSFYNQDLDNHPPADWVAFRKQIKAYDGVLFITPEYNRSVPGVLKNAIDVASRSYGQSLWDGKPCAIASSSLGAIGGFGANHHLRQSLVFLNMPCMPQPEFYLSNVAKLFDDQGNLTNEETKAFFVKFLQAFATWVQKCSSS